MLPGALGVRLGMQIPDLYQQGEQMALLSRAVKDQRGASCCILPFCHTVEAEALGGSVQYGDERSGPRSGPAVITSPDGLRALPTPLLDEGRIHQVLLAAKMLADAGETVVLNLSGPLSILNGLADFSLVLRTMKKEPQTMEKALCHIESMLLDYMEKAQDHGVQIISYADPGGGVDILGQRLALQMLRQFTYGFLKKADVRLKQDLLIMLCPKTALALTDTGYGKWRDIPLKKEVSYIQACRMLRGKVRFAGHLCAGTMEGTLPGNRFRELLLIPQK
ncbi:MAG: uroporphyrinogen decarboxylase family protein [Eubacteriales bacterium]|nr:uroporphyrinogen decarboxylase family protein [Eubacteriales bacterium]